MLHTCYLIILIWDESKCVCKIMQRGSRGIKKIVDFIHITLCVCVRESFSNIIFHYILQVHLINERYTLFSYIDLSHS